MDVTRPAQASTTDGLAAMHSISRKLELGGLNYSLIATAGTRGVHAFWVCEECDQGDYCYLHDSDDEAFAAAEAMARTHHQEQHAAVRQTNA